MGEQRRGPLLAGFGQACSHLTMNRVADDDRRVRLVDADGPFSRFARLRGVGQRQQPEATAQLGLAGERIDQCRGESVSGLRPAPSAIRPDERDEDEPIGDIGGDRDHEATAHFAARQLARVEQPQAGERDLDVACLRGRLDRRPVPPQLGEERRTHAPPRPPRRVRCVLDILRRCPG